MLISTVSRSTPSFLGLRRFSISTACRAIAPSITVPLGNGKTASIPSGIFINNEFHKAVQGGSFSVENPAYAKKIADIEEGSSADVDIAVKAARAAYEKNDREWGFGDPTVRAKLLYRLADIVEENADELAAIEATDTGKKYKVARNVDVRSVYDVLRYFAGYADKIYGKTFNTVPGVLAYTKPEPIGVCAQIIPWNFPALMFSWKIAPALATGNTIVMKSAETTPLFALKMCELIKQAGFPDGTMNLVSGYGKTVGQALADHMDIDKLAFTGSGPVGRQIMKSAASSNLKRVTLELGGKSPNIIFDDVKSVQRAAEWALWGIQMNFGQTCHAGTRIYVQDGVYDEFAKRFIALMKNVKVGDPFSEDTVQGPLNSSAQMERVTGWFKKAQEDGATLALGGEDLSSKMNGGYYVSPTVFTDVMPTQRIFNSEVFGPVVSLHRFSTEEEVIKQANDTVYGLAGAVFTNDVSRLTRVQNAIRAGTVWGNAYNLVHQSIDFGGFKESGIGRENGEAVLHNYLETKAVLTNIADIPTPLETVY